jgi:2-octaprenyl-6-methoxyphenol hydroxylase
MADNLAQKHYEIIIVGTGMVGSLLAIALSPFVDSILMLDKIEHELQRPMNKASRPLSLNMASIEALKQCALWDRLQPYATPIKQVHVSQDGYLGTTQFKADDYQLEALGYVVPADVLALTLLKSARELPCVDFQKIETIEKIVQDDHQVTLTAMIDGDSKSCVSDFLFGCDGSHSRVAQCIDAEKVEEGRAQFALICDLLDTDLKGIAYERFTRLGTLALLPKLGGHAGLVFTGDQKNVEALEDLSDVAFIAKIQAMMGDRLPQSMQSNKRFKKTLQSLKHMPLAQGQVLLLGNAARTLYPIAAQGFNLGLRDVMQLQAIFDYAYQVGSKQPEAMIEAFLKLREEDQKATSQLTAKIGNVFEKNHLGLSHLRGLGLIGLDLVTPLKDKVANRALGVTGAVKRVLKL